MLCDLGVILNVETGILKNAWQYSGHYALKLKPLTLPLTLLPGKYYLYFISGDFDLILCDLNKILSACGDYEMIVSETSASLTNLKRRGSEADFLRVQLAAAQKKITQLEIELLRIKPLLQGSAEKMIGEMTIVSPIRGQVNKVKPDPVNESETNQMIETLFGLD